MIGHLFPLLFAATTPVAPVTPVNILTIAAELRVIEMDAEPRTITIAAEPRTIEVQR